MTEIYDIIMMVGDLVLILMLLWFIAEIGQFYLENFWGASSRIIQEYVSGYLSMSNFAPPAFSSESAFPAVNHMMRISENLPFVFIKVGTRGTVSNPLAGEQFTQNIIVTFAQKPPLSYFLSDSIMLLGDCLGGFCAFSDESLNKIKITKNAAAVTVLLNRESAAAGSFYNLGKKIFYGECNSKTYSVEYMYAGTDSIHVQVKENGQIIKEGENPTIEIVAGETRTINSIKITVYSIDMETNIASIYAECA